MGAWYTEDMIRFTHIGHACFLVENGDKRWVFDPYDAERIGLEMPDISADYLMVSHEHGDHNYRTAVSGASEDFDAKVVASFHDDEGGKLRGENKIFVVEIDGVRICHLGDLGEILSDGQVAEIGEVDVLLVPVGGFYTIDAKGAMEVAEKIQPKVIVPMHYLVDGLTLDVLTGVDEFLELAKIEGWKISRCEGNCWEYAPDATGVVVF